MNISPSKKTLNNILLAAIATTLTASVIIGVSGTASANEMQSETQIEANAPKFAVEKSRKRVVNNGVLAYMKGDYSKAAAFNRDALHQGLKTSHMTVVYSNQCATLGAQGSYDKALEACDKALALTPTNWQAFSNRAAVNWLAGDKLQAKQDIISAKALDGTAPEVTYNMNVFG